MQLGPRCGWSRCVVPGEPFPQHFHFAAQANIARIGRARVLNLERCILAPG